MYHVIAAFLWASSGIVVDVDVDATCSKFNDMFFSFLFLPPHFIWSTLHGMQIFYLAALLHIVW